MNGLYVFLSLIFGIIGILLLASLGDIRLNLGVISIVTSGLFWIAPGLKTDEEQMK